MYKHLADEANQALEQGMNQPSTHTHMHCHTHIRMYVFLLLCTL